MNEKITRARPIKWKKKKILSMSFPNTLISIYCLRVFEIYWVKPFFMILSQDFILILFRWNRIWWHNVVYWRTSLILLSMFCSVVYIYIWIKKINVRHFVVCLFVSQSRKNTKKVNRLKILKLFFAVIKWNFF